LLGHLGPPLQANSNRAKGQFTWGHPAKRLQGHLNSELSFCFREEIRMRLLVKFALSILLLGTSSGCVVVPKIDGAAAVSLQDIAWRIKCDIWKVAAKRLYAYRKGEFNPYMFLNGWGAKVHITLSVDNTSSLNPGATLIEPLASSQFRSLGLGAGITTEAISATDFEFFMSFTELKKEYEKNHYTVENYCPPPPGLLLKSDLHIEDLFDRALEPVGSGLLRVGQHPGFGGSATPATPEAEIPHYSSAFGTAFKDLRNQQPNPPSPLPEYKINDFLNSQTGVNKLTRQNLIDQHTIDENKQIALQLENKAQAYINNIVKPVADILVASFPACVQTITQLRNEAIIRAVLVSGAKIDVDRATVLSDSDTALTKVRETLEGNVGKDGKKTGGLEQKVEDVLAELKECPSRKQPAPRPLMYDPLDLISQTMNFYITSSGSVTPSWKLVQVTAPLSGTFASASRKDTNTLIIAFGRPDLSKNGGGNIAVSNQILTSTLKDAIGPR
jgi:hypothetical protein